MTRFDLPHVAAPSAVTLPPVERSTLDNGIRVWTAPHRALPVVALAVIVDVGSVSDPVDLPGLCGLTVDLLDEGAGGKDSITLAESFGDIGATLDLQVGPDVMSASLWSLTRELPDAFALMADVMRRPHLEAKDLDRVRDLRLSRLQQLRRSAASAAERVFADAIFGSHGYGHSALGTTASVGRMSIDVVRDFFEQQMSRARLTVVAVGDIDHRQIVDLVARTFGDDHRAAEPPVGAIVAFNPTPITRFVERAGSAQSEIRVGHVSVARLTPDFHPLVLLNAGLGGSFSGRMNQRLRQQLGYTYGARSAFDMDRVSGTFSCDSSVQGDKTAESVVEIKKLVSDIIGAQPLTGDELELARATLTRGYARYFETPRQVAGAFAQMAIYGLPDDTFATYVPTMQGVGADDVRLAAQAHLHPDRFVTVVVGDPDARRAMEEAGMSVETVSPEF